MKVVTLIQTRLGSSRLPGKVLKEACGKTLLELMLERVLRAPLAGTVVVATTTDAQDDPIERLCEVKDWNCFRGHPTDLLDRHYQAGLKFGAEALVKIPSDCPLIDPRIIDEVIDYFLKNPFDYASNLHPPTHPDGNDVEIMRMDALATAHREARKDFEREHTTPFFWENPNRFRVGNLVWQTGLNYSKSHRWVLDYAEDYEFIRSVYEDLYPENPHFGIDEILDWQNRNSTKAQVNAHLAGVNWYRNHLGELKTISSEDTKSI